MPPLLVLGGVSGSGKTTVGRLVAASLAVPFADADAHHPLTNVEKMRAGTPLTDTDRGPWLDALAALLRSWHTSGEGGVLACSALKVAYRMRLRVHPNVRFALLAASPETLAARLAERTGHFFPPALLASQLSTLESAADVPLFLTDGCTPEQTAADVVRWIVGEAGEATDR